MDSSAPRPTEGSLDASSRFARLIPVLDSLCADPGTERGFKPECLRKVAQILGGQSVGLAFVALDEAVELASAEAAPQWQTDAGFMRQLASSTQAHAWGSFWVACQPGKDRWAAWLMGTSPEIAARPAELAIVGELLRSRIDQGELGRRVRGWSNNLWRRQSMEGHRAVVDQLIHDFNNVLASVLGFTELGLVELDRRHVAHRHLSEALQSVLVARDRHGMIGYFTRRQVARGMEAVVPEVLRTEADLLLATQAKASIDVALDVASSGLEVELPDEGLRLVLQQLFANAAQAMPNGGTIAVTARRKELSREDALDVIGPLKSGPHVWISIADQGAGFSDEAQEQVLTRPFFSTAARRKGLGLAIVYGILSHARGGVRLERSSPRGSEVGIYLPAA